MRCSHLHLWVGLACGLAAMPAESACQAQTEPWVAGPPSAEGLLPLRRASGLGQALVLPAPAASGVPPEALLSVSSARSGPDCRGPLVHALTVIGGALAGQVASVAENQTSLEVLAQWPGVAAAPEGALASPTSATSALRIALMVPEAWRAKLKEVRPGDRVRLRYTCPGECPQGPTAGAELSGLAWQQRLQPGWAPWLALFGSGLLVLLATALLTLKAPWRLAVGQDRRYSTSKFQLLVWFWVVISAYLAVNALRVWAGGLAFLGGVEIPANLLMLSGISMLSFATAKAITSSKVDAAGALAPDPKPPAQAPQVSDLVTDDAKHLDLGDFQIVLLTLIAAALYLGKMLHGLGTIELRQAVSLPEIDTTLLSLLGLGHAGYLGKKAAGEAGAGATPQQAVQQAQQLLEALRKQQGLLAAAADQATASRNDAAASAAQSIRALDKVAAQAAASAAASTARTADTHAQDAARIGTSTATDTTKLADLNTGWSQHPQAGPAVAQAHAEATRIGQAVKSLVDQAAQHALSAQVDAKAAAAQLSRFG